VRLHELDILATWKALGGGPLNGRRGKAFWRDGNNLTVSLDTAKGTWYDFRDARGGGALSLAELVLGCSRREALAFLEANCGLDPRKPLTPEERRAQAAAPVLAQRLADFAHGLKIFSERPLAILGPFLEEHAIDPAEALASFHRYAYIVRQSTPKDISELWRAMPEARDAVERIGRCDREHADAVAWALVDILAQDQKMEMAA
jgi:hypothetical protein